LLTNLRLIRYLTFLWIALGHSVKKSNNILYIYFPFKTRIWFLKNSGRGLRFLICPFPVYSHALRSNSRSFQWELLKMAAKRIQLLPPYLVELYTPCQKRTSVGHKICMIGSAKPGLKDDIYIVQKEEFSVTCCYMCDTYTLQKTKHVHKRQIYPLVREYVT
jgi:hypothetical protein